MDLPNGEILLPIRYRKDPKTRFYTTVVARCRFDDETLAYVEHGSEFTIPRERGLYEPSVAKFGDHFFLTMRADHSAFVARGGDGIHYDPFVEWPRADRPHCEGVRFDPAAVFQRDTAGVCHAGLRAAAPQHRARHAAFLDVERTA